MSRFYFVSTSSANADRLSARDRRCAAVHEAGHLVVARHLGVIAFGAEIRKIEAQGIDEKEWIGSVRCQTGGIDPSKRRMVAVAGIVAEACWDQLAFDDFYNFEFFSEGMSESDWEMSGCVPSERSEHLGDAMEQAFELLNSETGKLWNALLLEARRLIVRSRQEALLAIRPS
jgi:hypothetical protein